MEKKDYYKILGVERSSSADEIRKAYRKLARKYHPDINPGDKAAEERFKEISVANEVLGDAEKRKRYDEFGEAGLSPEFDPEKARAYHRWQEQSAQTAGGSSYSEVDLGDLFEGFGGLAGLLSGRSSSDKKLRRGEDIETHMEINFLDAVRGFQANFSIQRPVSCSDCKGSDYVAAAEAKQCQECRGTGWKESLQRNLGIRQTSARCNGNRKLTGTRCV